MEEKSATRATKKWHTIGKHKNLWVLTILSFIHCSLLPKVLFTYTVMMFKWVVMKNNELCDDWNWSASTCHSP